MAFLGHIALGKGILVDPDKVQVVKGWPVPKSTTEIRSFLGLAGYYRRFVQNFSKIVGPLTKLTRKGEKYVWSTECAIAFEELKNILISALILKMPDETEGMVIYSDASG